VANSAFTNCQIYNFTLSNHHSHISIFTLQTWQVYIILRAAQNVRTVLKKNPLIAHLLKKVFFPQTLFFRAVFFWGGWGACISGLPSYLLAYILTNLHPHLLRPPIHLPTYLPRCKPLLSPTCNLGYQLMTKYASLQVCKSRNYKSIIQIKNLIDCKCTFASSQVCKCTSLQVDKFASTQNYQITKLQNIKLQSYKLKIFKIINCTCLFVNFKFINL
jgi:hypothetical protein